MFKIENSTVIVKAKLNMLKVNRQKRQVTGYKKNSRDCSLGELGKKSQMLFYSFIVLITKDFDDHFEKYIS